MIASVHSSFRMTAEQMTERIIKAIEHPLVDALGHPSGRKLERRDPYAFDVHRVIEAAARSGTMLEINSNPDRRDLDETNARAAAAAGVPIVINTDSHRTAGLRRGPLRDRHRAPRVADRRPGGQHAAVGSGAGAPPAPPAGSSLSASPRPSAAPGARLTSRSAGRRLAIRAAGLRSLTNWRASAFGPSSGSGSVFRCRWIHTNQASPARHSRQAIQKFTRIPSK